MLRLRLNCCNSEMKPAPGSQRNPKVLKSHSSNGICKNKLTMFGEASAVLHDIVACRGGTVRHQELSLNWHIAPLHPLAVTGGGTREGLRWCMPVPQEIVRILAARPLRLLRVPMASRPIFGLSTQK